MIFKTVAEAFNHYRNFSNEQLEKRAQEIKGTIETDPNVDLEGVKIELEAIKQAQDNNNDKGGNSDPDTRANVLNLITTLENNNAFTRDNVESSKEYRNAFLKSLLNRQLTASEKRAFNMAMEKRASFNSSSDTGAVLPTQTLNEVINKARTQGGLLAECRAFNIPCNIAVPIGTPSNKATWHEEGASVEAEKVNLASVSFGGYEIIKVFSISAKVQAMSIDAFESYLTDELSNCVMECIADAVINGSGSGQGTGLEKGITWTEGTNLKTVATIPEYQDFTKFMALVKRGYAQGSKIAMNNSTLYGVVYSIVDDNGRPIFVADPKNENIGFILGVPVVIDDNIADKTIYLGNFSKYYGYNLVDGITIEASRESSFKSGKIDFRALAIADCKPLVQEAFYKMVFTAEV